MKSNYQNINIHLSKMIHNFLFLLSFIFFYIFHIFFFSLINKTKANKKRIVYKIYLFIFYFSFPFAYFFFFCFFFFVCNFRLFLFTVFFFSTINSVIRITFNNLLNSFHLFNLFFPSLCTLFQGLIE